MAFLATFGPVSLPSNSANQYNNIFRNVIPPSLLVTSGSLVQVQLAGGGSTYQISDMYIGHQGTTGTSWDFDGNQVRVTFGSGGTGCIVSAGITTVSDAVTFSLDKSKTLIVSFYGTSAPMGTYPYVGTAGAGCQEYYLASTAGCGKTHLTGMSASTLFMVTAEVDTQQGNGVIAQAFPMLTISCRSGNFLTQPAYVDFYPILNCVGGTLQYGEVNSDLWVPTLTTFGGYYVIQ